MLIFVVLGFFKRNIPINISISYIHYLINVDFWCYITAIYFALIGINYLALYWIKKTPNNWLTSTHILLKIFCLTPYLAAIFSIDEAGNFTNSKIPFQENSNIILISSFFIFLVSVLVHLIIFFNSLLLKRD